MTAYLGNEGRISRIDGDGDIYVTFTNPRLTNSSWCWNPASFTRVTAAATASTTPAAAVSPGGGKLAVGDLVRLGAHRATVEQQSAGHGGWIDVSCGSFCGFQPCAACLVY